MKRSRILYLVVAAALSVAANYSVRADIVTLIDGTVHEGEVIRENSESITLRVHLGGNFGSVVIPRREVLAIRACAVPSDPVLNDGVALQRKAAAETDPKKAVEAWVKTGEYYRDHPGFSNLASAAFQKALLYDTDNATARAYLGFEKTANGWAEIQKPKAKPRDELPPVVTPAKLSDDELTIGLRRDVDQIKKILDDQQARRRAQEQLEAQPRQWVEQPRQWAEQPRVYSGYARDYLYVGPYGNTYYVPYSTAFGYTDYAYQYPAYTSPYYNPYGSGYYGRSLIGSSYGGYGYGFGSGYGGYGLGVGFRGRVGSFRVNGSFNTGGSGGFFTSGAGFRGSRF